MKGQTTKQVFRFIWVLFNILCGIIAGLMGGLYLLFPKAFGNDPQFIEVKGLLFLVIGIILLREIK